MEITSAEMQKLVASAAAEAIRDYDMRIHDRVRRMLQKAEAYFEKMEEHQKHANVFKNKFEMMTARINRLRAGDWRALLEEDDFESENGHSSR